MDITPTQPQTPTAAGTSTEQANAVLSSDFETFLKMLTAQARYQDPLEPVDSSEYAAQLAQFSMVEQQVLSNDLLTALSDQLGSSNIGQMASWIGMEARTSAPVQFDGSPITVQPQPNPTADEAFLIVKNVSGAEVQRRQIDTSNDPIEWDGTSADGSPLPTGVYEFVVESRTAGDTLGVTQAEAYARITEARRQGTEIQFILEGGSAIASTDVTALREGL